MQLRVWWIVGVALCKQVGLHAPKLGGTTMLQQQRNGSVPLPFRNGSAARHTTSLARKSEPQLSSHLFAEIISK